MTTNSSTPAPKCQGCSYPKLGITITFGEPGDVTDTVAWIDCDEKVNINGARAGMDFAQFQKILGKSKVKESWEETPENSL